MHESLSQHESVPYAESKGGLQMFTKTVALDVTESGIRVNDIAPGTIDTDLNKKTFDDEYKKNRKSRIYLCIGSGSLIKSQSLHCFGLILCKKYHRNNYLCE